MARRIVDAGFDTTLWARRAATLEPFAASGAHVADTPGQLATQCDLICLCVVNDADVRQVVDQMLDSLVAGAVIAVQSTVHPQTCRDLAVTLGDRGVRLIDAPVSGGAPAAAAGRLAVMIGGDAEVVEHCRPVFDTFGEPVVHVGPLGSGQLVKLVNNALMAAHAGLADDAFRLGTSLGLDRAAMTEIITRGSGNSFSFGILGRLGSLEKLGEGGGDILRKDVDIVTAIALEAAAPAGSLIELADRALERMGRPGH